MATCARCKAWVSPGASDCARCGALFTGEVAPETVAAEDPVAPPANRPWLKRKDWKQRRIVSGSAVGGGYLALAYLFFSPFVLLCFWYAFAPASMRNAEVPRLLALAAGSMFAFILGVLTYWRMRHRRYGDSVCRLITLPGVVGGWLKADVDCSLPAGTDPAVTVRLKNAVYEDKQSKILWAMEQRCIVPVTPGARTTVPVRLRIPRHPAQRPIGIPDGFWSWLDADRLTWALEIEKNVPGIDFLATFLVPVYDTRDAPASEQEDETPRADR